MKYVIFFIFLVLFEAESIAQHQLSAGIGQSFTTIKFKNSKGEANERYQFVGGDRLQIGYGIKLGNVGFLQIEPGYRFGGAKLIDQSDLNELQLHYADMGVAYEYAYRFSNIIMAKIGIGFYGAYLIAGQQQIANRYFNLKETKDLSPADMGYQLRGGIYHNLTPHIQLGLQYALLGGLLNLESGAANEGQKSRLMAHTISVGLISEILK